MKLFEWFLPKSKRTLWIWVLLLGPTMWCYYGCGNLGYTGVETWYNKQRVWKSSGTVCNDDETSSEGKNCDEITLFLPNYVANFMASEAEISYKNTAPRDAVIIRLELLPNESDDIRICASGQKPCQSSVVLRDIPPGSETKVSFSIRISGDKKGQQFSPQVFINNKKVTLLYSDIKVTWDPFKRFRLWVVDMFLLPPASNLVIPLWLWLLVILSETMTEGNDEQELTTGHTEQENGCDNQRNDQETLNIVKRTLNAVKKKINYLVASIPIVNRTLNIVKRTLNAVKKRIQGNYLIAGLSIIEILVGTWLLLPIWSLRIVTIVAVMLSIFAPVFVTNWKDNRAIHNKHE